MAWRRRSARPIVAAPTDTRSFALFKSLKALIAPAPQALHKPVSPAHDYRAVMVIPGIECCEAVRFTAGERYLLKDAPKLPLPNCTNAENCSCRFKKIGDRRDADRRQLGVWEANRWYGGPEHRSGRDRRAG